MASKWNIVIQNWALLCSDKSMINTSCELCTNIVWDLSSKEQWKKETKVFTDLEHNNRHTILHSDITTNNCWASNNHEFSLQWWININSSIPIFICKYNIVHLSRSHSHNNAWWEKTWWDISTVSSTEEQIPNTHECS